jgi:hypothetical protein
MIVVKVRCPALGAAKEALKKKTMLSTALKSQDSL